MLVFNKIYKYLTIILLFMVLNFTVLFYVHNTCYCLSSSILIETSIINQGAKVENGVILTTNGSGRIILHKDVVIEFGARIVANDGQTIEIGQGTIILSGAQLKGDIAIGDNCEIAGVLGDFVKLGNNVKIHRQNSNLKYVRAGDNIHINGSVLKGYGRGKNELVEIAGGSRQTRIEYSTITTKQEKLKWRFIEQKKLDAALSPEISQFLLNRYKVEPKNSYIGQGTNITGATVKNSVILEDVLVKSPAYIENAVIQNSTRVEPYSKITLSFIGKHCTIGSEISKSWIGDGFVSGHQNAYVSAIAPNDYLIVNEQGQLDVISLPNTTNIAGGTVFANYGGQPGADLKSFDKGTAFIWTLFTGANSRIINKYDHPDIGLKDILKQTELTMILPFCLTKGEVWGLIFPFTYADRLSPKSHKIGWVLDKYPGLILTHLINIKKFLLPEQTSALDNFIEGTLRLGLYLIEQERRRPKEARRWTDAQLDYGEKNYKMHLESGIWRMQDGNFVKGDESQGFWEKIHGRWINRMLSAQV